MPIGCAVGIFAVLAVIAGGIAIANNQPYSGDTTACVVESKDRASKEKGGSDMRLYTSCGVFSVSDSFWQGQWNSADIYAKIQPGHTYDFKAVGFRNGLFSAFPNVLSATEVSQ
jgi:hypothetical protein